MSTTANITVYKNGVTLAPVVHRVRLVTGGAAAHNASASAHAGLFDPAGSALTAQAAAIAAAQALVDDLSGVNDAATARENLGLGSAAVEDAGAFDAAGAASTAQAAAQAYTNAQIAALNLGTAAQADAVDFDPVGSASAAQAAAQDYADGLASNYDPAGAAATAQSAAIAAAGAMVDDLSGVSDAETARSNLGLGSAALADTADFDAAGAAAAVAGDLASHEADTANPHAVTAAQAGADPSGSAAAAQSAAIAAAGALVDDLSGVSNAATARSNLGLGTMATEAAADYAALAGATFAGAVGISSAKPELWFAETDTGQTWKFVAQANSLYLDPETANASFQIRNLANVPVMTVNTNSALVTFGLDMDVTGDLTVAAGLLVADSVTGTVEIAGDLILSAPSVPASAGASGTAGSIAWDSDYIYICTAANTWKRAALATW